MDVILKEDVPKLGRRGEVVKVADGYGRNYLLPRRLAIEANIANLKNIEHMRSAAKRREVQDTQSAQDAAAKLNQVTLTFTRRAGEHDTLFGSVTSMDIAEGLKSKGFDVDRRKIDLHEPIKTLGQFKVPVNLYRNIAAQITVEIQREERAAS